MQHTIATYKIIALTVLAGLLLTALSSCDQTPETPTPVRERSFLSVIHAYDGVPSIDVELESFTEKKTVTEGLAFNSTWPRDGYASLLSEAGSGPQDTGVVIRLKDWRSKDQIVPDRVISLTPARKSTIGIIDSMGRPEIIRIIDNFDTPKAGRANVRFMNLTYLYPAVDLVSQNDSIYIDRINYLLASKFIDYPAGTYNLYFRHSFTGRNLDSIMNVELKSRKTYNIYLTQKGNAPRKGLIELE